MARNGGTHISVARLGALCGVALTAALAGGLSACQPVEPHDGSPDPAAAGRSGPVSWVADFEPDAQLVARVGQVGEVRPVGPRDGELSGLSRDAGVSVELSDGSVVWFFGDTALFEPDGSMRFFEIGSAAWASPLDPFVTLDHAERGSVQAFARPTRESPRCPPDAPSAGLWPLSAVLDPHIERDRVVIWMANICLGANRAAVGRGVSVGQWWYDPDDPPAHEPVEVEILESRIFGVDGPRFGDAALVDGAGGAYVYGCDLPDPPQGPSSGPCRVAWVELGHEADARQYLVWDGSSWTPGAEPAEVDFAGEGDRIGLPSGPMSVARDPGSGAVVMVYSPWPSYVPFAWVRVAPTPVGPFGEPTRIELPGCLDELRGHPRSCYAANTQAFASEVGRLGIGWHDQMLEPGDRGGTFVASSVVFAVEAVR